MFPEGLPVAGCHPALGILGDGRQHQPAEGLRQVDQLLVAFQGDPFVEGWQNAGHLALADALQCRQGLQRIPHAVHRQLIQPGGDEQVIGGDQGGEMQQVDRGGAVQHDHVIPRVLQHVRQDVLAQGHPGQGLLQGGGALVGADHIQVVYAAGRDGLIERAMQIWGEQPAQVVAVGQTQAVGHVALGVQVDQEHSKPFLARPEANVTAVVVLPTPPFWFRIAIVVGIIPLLTSLTSLTQFDDFDRLTGYPPVLG